MIFVGHIAIAVTAVQISTQFCRYQRRIDLRKIALVSILPDLIDKPLAFCLPEEFGYHTRLYAHSLLFCVLMIPVFIAARRRLGPPLLYWLTLCSHLVLDQMWVAHEVMLFWPLLGEPKPQRPVAIQIFDRTSFNPDAYAAELVGLLLLFLVAVHYRLYRRDKLIALLKTGHLD